MEEQSKQSDIGRLPGRNRFGETNVKPDYITTDDGVRHATTSREEKKISWNKDPRSEAFTERLSQKGKGPRNFNITDQRLFEKVCDALVDHPAIDASEIEVKVSQGIVTLSGGIEGRHTMTVVEELVRDIDGVKSIRNDLNSFDSVEGWVPGLSPEEKRKYNDSFKH